MVEERLADGRRIAQLFASEIDGRDDGELSELAVVEPDPDVEPTTAGAFAYGIDRAGERIADTYVHPERMYLEIPGGHEAVVAAAEREGLRVRPKAVDPPKTLVFIENGAEAKRATAVIEAAVP